MGLMLASCGVKPVELVTTDTTTITDKDYLKLLNNEIPVDDRREIVLSRIVLDLADKDEIENLYNKMVDYEESFYEESGLTDADKEYIRGQAELLVGLYTVYNDLGVITEKDLKTEYNDGVMQYEIMEVNYTVEESEKDNKKDKVKEILKNSEDVLGDLDELGIEEYYTSELSVNKYTIPYEFEGVLGKEKGYVGSEEFGEVVVVYKVTDVNKKEFEDVKYDIFYKLIQEKQIDSTELIDKLEKKNKVKISKEMRELLDLDRDKVQ